MVVKNLTRPLAGPPVNIPATATSPACGVHETFEALPREPGPDASTVRPPPLEHADSPRAAANDIATSGNRREPVLRTFVVIFVGGLSMTPDRRTRAPSGMLC